jgi:hypothetical protein
MANGDAWITEDIYDVLFFFFSRNDDHHHHYCEGAKIDGRGS